jgi:hypothetical protein
MDVFATPSSLAGPSVSPTSIVSLAPSSSLSPLSPKLKPTSPFQTTNHNDDSPMKIYDIKPALDVPSLSRIRFPSWLKSLYNISQMELTTLDPLGAFYLVALDDDRDSRPENQNRNNAIRPRSLFALPPMYSGTAQPAAIVSYNIKAVQFEHQQRVRADLHSAISRSLGTVTLQFINSKYRFGTGSLSPLDLVCQFKIMFDTITKHEIDATQEAILAHLVHFSNFRDFCNSITKN